jgi:hypothetical protein
LRARTDTEPNDPEKTMIVCVRQAHLGFAALRSVAAPLNVKWRIEALKLLVFIATWRLLPLFTTTYTGPTHSQIGA